MIIDCHGHYTTAPKQHEQWRLAQIEAHSEGKGAPPRPAITDDEIRDSIVNGQLKMQRERGTDVTIFSPRAAGMGHHLGNAATSEAWADACNTLIHRVDRVIPQELHRGLYVAANRGSLRRRTAFPSLIAVSSNTGS